MTETQLTEIQGGKKFDPAYTLREPTIGDVSNLAGVIARGAKDPEFLQLIREKNNEGAMIAMFASAFADAGARADLMFTLGDMWEHSPPDLETPYEMWDYDPDPELVEKGQAISRELQWRSISRANRRRIINRHEIENLPFRVLKDMWLSLKENTDINDFLGMASSFIKEKSGESTTESNDATDGPTNE